MKSIRITVLGAAAMALSMPMGLSFQSEAQASPDASTEAGACLCTCDACVAKHGKKAAPVAQPNLPDAGVDIEAEVARVLATDLASVDALLATEAESAPEPTAVAAVGITSAGVAEVVEVPEAAPTERGFMGISLAPNEEGGGALVGTVNAGSPAEKGGLKDGDLIVAAEGMPLDSNEDLIAAVIDLKVGDTATVEVERGDEELEFEIKLGPRNPVPTVVGVPIDPVLEDVTNGKVVTVLEGLGYLGDVEEEVTLPSSSPTLLFVAEDGKDGNTFTFESSDDAAKGVELRRRLLVGKEVEIEEESAKGDRVQLRWSTDPGPIQRDRDALPDGYVEVYTRRERRPAGDDALRARMAELEAEVAELSKVVAELRAELDRRNPR